MANTFSKSFKAQFWSFDLIFSVVIFSFAITLLAYTWFSTNNQLANMYSATSVTMQRQAQDLSRNLMSTGAPADWQSAVNTLNAANWGNVSIGLASSASNGSISSNKLYALMSMVNYNYLAAKQPLGVAFDYYITVVSNPSSANTLNISIGLNPSTNGAIAIYAQTMSSTLNGLPVVVTVNIWSNTTFALG